MITEIESHRVKDIEGALNRLEDQIAKIERRESMNGMTIADRGIQREILNLKCQANDLEDIKSKELKEQVKIQQRMAWVALKPSCLINQNYIIKFVEEKRRLEEEERRRALD